MTARFNGKSIIFAYKNKKIIKSAKENKHIHWRTDEDIKKELKKAFISSFKDGETRNGRSCFPKRHNSIYRTDQEHGETLEGIMENISIEITTMKEDTTFLIAFSLGEFDDDKKEVDKRNKIWFTDAIAYFYKELKSRPTTIHFLIDTVPPIV